MKAEKGVPVTFMFYGPETYYDATHPGARNYLWEKIRENYYSIGIKNFWLDEAEPEMRPYDFDNVRYYLGNGLEVGNIYPVLHSKAFYDGMRGEGEEDVVNLVRCAWHGSQRFGSVVWSGDVESSFDSLRKQMKAGLNIAMCGIPWWTTDIGGFINGDPGSPEFRELIVRWFQYGAFCPIFRLHGYRLPYKKRDLFNPVAKSYSGGPNEVWSFGEEAYEIIVALIKKRYSMIPYLMAHMKKASETGTPVMRPLLFDFPSDPQVYSIGDEYMFGSDLLVAPVIAAGARERSVYLPAGETWTDMAKGTRISGGETVTVPAPLDTIPLFLRANAVDPFDVH
jgi:alpha-D-xyloside xylohydrolase